MRLALTLPFFLLVAACGPSLHDQKVLSAKRAHARGDLGAEAIAWSEACQAEPDRRASCDEAQRSADALHGAAVKSSGPVCESGELAACAHELASLRKVRPSDPEALSLLRGAEGLHRARCAKLERRESTASTLARWSCMGSLASLVSDPPYEAMLVEERTSAAKRFSAAAHSASPAASYVYHRTAQCLSRAMESEAQVQAAAEAFVRSAAVPIAVRARTSGPSLLPSTASACGYVAEELGPRARCARGEIVAPEFAIELALTLGAVDHRVSSEMRVAEYVSGVERYANPERPSAEVEVNRTQASFDAIEQETQDREARCNRTRTQHACDAYNAIVPTYNQRQQNLNFAKRRLAETPAVLERNIVTRISYAIRHHTWSVAYAVEARSQAGVSAHREGVFERSDSESPAIAPAGVAADALVAPSLEDFNAELSAIARSVAAGVFAEAFRQRSNCGAAAWALDDSAKLECRARAELYLHGELPKPGAWGVDCR